LGWGFFFYRIFPTLSSGSGYDSEPSPMGIEMPPNSLETLHALTKALPGKRAAGGPLPFNRRETSNPWDNVPDQPLVR
jgi:hypothetical protein